MYYRFIVILLNNFLNIHLEMFLQIKIICYIHIVKIMGWLSTNQGILSNFCEGLKFFCLLLKTLVDGWWTVTRVITRMSCCARYTLTSSTEIMMLTYKHFIQCLSFHILPLHARCHINSWLFMRKHKIL
jgi:hypothetical protein